MGIVLESVMKKRIVLICSVIFVFSTVTNAVIVSWDASSGVLPYDASIPPEHNRRRRAKIPAIFKGI
jgi:hypothetical protein